MGRQLTTSWIVVDTPPMLRAVALMSLMTALAVPHTARAQRYHTVRRGQSLAAIARRNHVTRWNLALANRVQPTDVIQAGQVLEIPPPGVVYVRPGHTLGRIARRQGCTVRELLRLNHLRRSAITRLQIGQRLITPGYEAARPRDWGAASEPGVLRIRGQEGEAVRVPIRDGEGRILQSGLASLAGVMRRVDRGGAEQAVRLPDPRLGALLTAISDHFGGREVVVISGFREVGGYTSQRSQHVAGHATDIRVMDVPNRLLWNYCMSLAATGCGYYPRSTFVHVDVRPRIGQWVDWSGPGERPRFGTLRGPYGRHVPRQERNRIRRRISRRAELPLDVQIFDDTITATPTQTARTSAPRRQGLQPTATAL